MNDTAKPQDPAGDAVRDALTKSEQTLGAAVLVVNLALGAWFIAHSDFSKVRPNQRAAEAIEPIAPPSNITEDLGTAAGALPMPPGVDRIADSRTP